MTTGPIDQPCGALAELAKARLRLEIRDRLRAMSPDEHADASARIAGHLMALPAFTEARSILLYAPLPREPDLRAVIEHARDRGVTVLLPRSRREPAAIEVVPLGSDPLDELPPDELGVPAPTGEAADPATIDLAIVPGVAFDAGGGRLGRGGGYYDRLLAMLPPSTKAIGVCFAAQVVAAVPRDSHDRRVDRVVIETGPLQPFEPSHR